MRKVNFLKGLFRRIIKRQLKKETAENSQVLPLGSSYYAFEYAFYIYKYIYKLKCFNKIDTTDNIL